MKIGIYVIVAIVVIALLVIILVVFLRSQARQRQSSITDYNQGVNQKETASSSIPMSTVPVTAERDGLKTNPTTTAPEWEQRSDPATGRNYYYNTVSGVTQWEAPDGFQA